MKSEDSPLIALRPTLWQSTMDALSDCPLVGYDMFQLKMQPTFSPKTSNEQHVASTHSRLPAGMEDSAQVMQIRTATSLKSSTNQKENRLLTEKTLGKKNIQN